MKKWIEEEIVLLKNNYEKFGVIKLSELLSRSYYSVQKKARRLNLRFRNKSWKNEIDFLITNENAILTYFDIIKTFNQKQQEFAFNYIKAKLMRQQGLTLRNIANELKISEQTLRGWSSKTTPKSIKCVIKLTQLKLLPLIPNDTLTFKVLLKIFAWIFGDGNLNNNLTSITLCGNKKTLQIFEKEIKLTLPSLKCKLETRETKGEFQGRVIEGKGNSLILNNATVSRLLYAAGAPKGDKIVQALKLPQWITKLSNEFKSIFLGILWSADGTKPIWSKRGFYLCFQLSKVLELKKEHENFMNEIRKLLDQFDIKSSLVRWSKASYIRNRDGKMVSKSYFYVSCDTKNYIKFFKFVPNFSEDRKREFLRTLEIVEDKISKSKERFNLFLEVKKIFEEGKSIKEISEKFKLPYSTVKVWVRGINSPVKLFSDTETINKISGADK